MCTMYLGWVSTEVGEHGVPGDGCMKWSSWGWVGEHGVPLVGEHGVPKMGEHGVLRVSEHGVPW